MSVKTILNDFSYNTKNPVTVRHASLLNAVTSLKSHTVYQELQKIIEALTKKTQTDEILSALFILKRDSNWVKKMFMGAKGIDITVTACVNKRGPKKMIDNDKIVKKNKKTPVSNKNTKKEKSTNPEKKKRNKKDKSSESFKETENTKI